MRIVLRIVLIALLAALIVLIGAACKVLGYQLAPTKYPPPATAVTAAQAASLAAQLAGQPTVERQDLTIELAPSRAATVQLFVDGQSFYPAQLADMQAA